MPDMESPSTIVVAIDFGTTYSGIAYMRLGEISPKVMTRWPEPGYNLKVRSEIEYDSEGHVRGWGSGADTGKQDSFSIFWFKNFLATPGQDKPEVLRRIIGSHFPTRISVQVVVTDYIEKLYGHIVDTLIQDGEVAPDKVTSSLEFVFTYPAIWKESTLQAYKNALSLTTINEFMIQNKVYFLKEPEAAMIGTLSSPRPALRTRISELTRQESAGSHGNAAQRVVILDLGGGTLDFSSYNVRRWNPLELEELNVDGKHNLGGTNVDRAFLEYFQKLLHEHNYRREIPRWAKQALLREFGTLKHSFPRNKFYLLRLPVDDTIPWNLSSAGIKNGGMRLSEQQMSQFFDPTVNQVIEFLEGKKALIRGNLKRAEDQPTIFFLVGGFGESKYVQSEIEKWIGTKAAKANLVTPSDSWTAVVTGAVQYGRSLILDTIGPVRVRACRHSLGVVTDVEWVAGEHNAADKGKDDRGKKIAKRQIKWFVNKGEPLNSSRRFTVNLVRTSRAWPDSWSDVMARSDLNAVSAPKRYDSPGVGTFCEVKSHVATVPKDQREKSRSWFKSFYIVRYQLQITFAEAGMLIETRYRGRTYGRAQVRYNDHLGPEESAQYFRDIEMERELLNA